ncbi:hypothetical protein M0805_004630 [Coniferiporia weirii]|nr:hypothetical protein M0805_004630 [Coniferiporia weirii]
MLSTSLSVCARCRRPLLTRSLATAVRGPPEAHAAVQRTNYRNSYRPPPPAEYRGGYDRDRPSWPQKQFRSRSERLPRPSARDRLQEELHSWVRQPKTLQRLVNMGIEDVHAQRLLEVFVEEMPRTPGGWFPPTEDGTWQMDRIEDELRANPRKAFDGALTRRFMAWALATLRTRGLVPAQTYATLAAVHDALDYAHPAEWYGQARMLRRRVHMHVGPTNSGKTHAALRALAAAKHGLYASPLRLLAYEVFYRLNNGRIVPAGADPNAPPETHKRVCNLLTGEESRMIDPNAGLLSCTIEMFSPNARYEVAVVDEIQMLSDPERGGAWTAAVLGLNAQELHLCGEAGAVPLVQSMLKDTGDEIIVHRYDRLTPLTVAPTSLEGNFKNIQKGDCVVSFSRDMLFALKRRIENETGMRCAIIYGRLPPEVRSEQADLFNDPDSGYDVLIGSDAIGMGLNLMIKRIVFESTMKWDGAKDVRLSLSQLKQIAGRAGRYGLHDGDLGGVVTTLNDEDLPHVRRAVDSRTVPLSKRAILPAMEAHFGSLEQILRPGAGFAAMLDLQDSAARMAPCYQLRNLEKLGEAVQLIDTLCVGQTLEERMRVLHAPVVWRDVSVAQASQRLMQMYVTDSYVKLLPAFSELKLLEALEEVNTARTTEDAPPVKPETLLQLESLYRVAVMYMWFSMRLPLAFCEREEAVKMKEASEKAIEWCLETTRDLKMKHRRTKATKSQGAPTPPDEYVQPVINEPLIVQT